MKKLIIFLLCLSMFQVSCEEDEYSTNGVPSIVLNEFEITFPSAKDIDWEKKNEGYEVDFEKDNQDHAAFISPAGEMVKWKKEVSKNDLPSQIRTSLSRDYGDKDIGDFEIVVENGKTYYQFQIENFLFDENVVLNESGKTDTETPYWD